MRSLFFGTPDIAVPALEALHEISEVVGVICQPDRPAGRGLRLKAPPIRQRAEALGLEVTQPRKIRTRSFAEWIRSYEPDVALVMAYGRILPPAVLEGPSHGCINLHASLLPGYRGAAPINWAIVGGETETGISLMQMDQGCDTGPVYTMRRVPIAPNDTAGDLAEVLARLAGQVVREDLPRVLAGELSAVAQDHGAASAAPLIKKEDGCVDWTKPSQRVHDHIRGMTPWPGAHTWARGKRCKILEASLAETQGELGRPGQLLLINQQHAEVACGEGSLFLRRGQMEGRRVCDACELAAGRSLAVDMVLGEPPAEGPPDGG